MASTNITTFPGKVGVSNANPTHTLSIGSNVYVDDTGSNKLTVTGVISGDGLGISNIQTVNVLGLTDNVTRIGTLETDLDNNSSRISTVSTDLSDNSSRISTVSTDLSDNSSRISTVSTDLADNSSRISTVSTDLSDNSSRISTVSTDLSDNSSRITSLESGASSISGVKTFQDDIILESNLRVKGDLTYANTVNMIVSDPIIELGANNQHTNDLGLVLTRHGNSGNDSNVAIFYDETADTLKIGYTDDGASQTTLTTTTTGLDVSITGNVAAAYDTDETSYFGRAAVGYMGQSDQASFSHLDKNTSANFALKQAASGATHLNTPTGQHIRFSVNASEVGRFTGGGDFEVGTSASTKKLIVDTSASEVQMYSQATGSTAGPDLVLMRDNGSNAGSNNQYIGQIRYEGLSDTGNSRLYAKTTGKIKTATNGSEDGVIETMIKTGGSNRISVRHSGAKFLIQKGTDLQVGEVANLYVDTSTSRVGINVASPSYTLDVGGDVNLSTGSTLRINGIPAVFSNWTANGSDIYRSSGNVGIGTTSPATYLHLSAKNSDPGSTEGDLVGTHTLTEYMRFTSTGDGGDVNGVTVGFKLGGDDNSSVNPDGRLDICANDGASAGNGYGLTPDRTIATFLGSGNVGIGTTSPDYQLDIHNDDKALMRLKSNKTSGDGDAILYLDSSQDGESDIDFMHDGVMNWRLRTGDASGTNFQIHDSGDASCFAIKQNGNVGIGTASPQTKLNVRGSVSTGRNLAREVGTVISYSSQFTTARGAANVINGDKNFENGNNDWITASGQRANAYLVIDLGTAYAVDRLVIYNQNEYSNSMREVKGFKLQGSADNSTWTDVITSECGRSNAHEANPGWSFRIPQNWDDDTEGSSYRYWKFTMTSFHGTNSYGGIMELELYEASNALDDEVSTSSLVAEDVYGETGNFSRGVAIGKGYGGTSTGANRLLVEGNVGIGTTSPGYKLHVSGDINFTGTLYQNGTAFSGGGSSVWSTSGSNIYYNTGNVGIGTASPATKLHIYDTSTEPTIAFQHLSSNENNSSTNVLGNLCLHRSHRSGVGNQVGIRSIRRAGTWDDQADMEFYVRNGGHGSQTAMVINSGGNANSAKVGIGTTSPSHPLTVQETTTNTNTVTYPLAIRAISSGTVANGFGAGIRFQCERRDTDDYQSLAGSVEVYGAGNLPGTSDLWNMRFGVRNNDTAVTPMTLKYNGNVGIGTTSPGHILHVEGTSSTSPIYKGAGAAATSTFNYILNAPKPGTTSGGAVHFINGSTRSTDGGQSTYTIRNDSGALNLGNSNHATRILSSSFEYSNGDDSVTVYGPNTTWNSYLFVGAASDRNPNNNSDRAQVITTNGNLHLDAGGSRDIYMNYYSGNYIRHNGLGVYSDDRLKTDEELITNATDTLLKLSPQKYLKKYTLRENETREPFTETGLIAQDIWYDAPELRHIVMLGADADPTENKPEAPVDGDIQQDPDYSSWGPNTASVNYDGLIAYLVKSNQELHGEIQALKARIAALENA